MTTTELKQLLIQAHKRDKRLTMVRYGLVTTTIAAIVVGAYFLSYGLFKAYVQGVIDFFDASKNPSANIYTIVVVAALLTGMGYIVYDLLRLGKRMQHIDAFIAKIEAGGVASHIFDQKVYKIKIWLGKITLNLYPMTQVSVAFAQETGTYKLPIPAFALPDLKTLLSGVNTADTDKAWYELYDGKTADTAARDALKPTADFEHFVDSELHEELQEVEQKRSKGKKNYYMYLIPSLLVAGAWMFFNYKMSAGDIKIDSQTLMIGFVIVMVIYAAVVYLTKVLPAQRKNRPMEESFEHQYKTKVFSKMVAFINPNFKYVLHGHISLPEFLEMGFFENKQYDLDGNDQIMGKHSGVPFQLCDLSVERKRNFTSEKEGADNVFYGQVFVAKFNKSFKNDVYIVPKKMGGIFSSSDTDLHLDYLGGKVQLEDPEFMKMFNVYAADQVEARYILTTAMMQRIKEMSLKNKGKYLISFRNNRIAIANNSGRNNFEVSMFKSITKNKQSTQFYDELCAQLQMIDDLKLNINIWK